MDYLTAVSVIAKMPGRLLIEGKYAEAPGTANETEFTFSTRVGVYRCRYADTPNPVAKQLLSSDWVNVSCRDKGLATRQLQVQGSPDECAKVAMAWRAMAGGPPADSAEQAAAFQNIAARHLAEPAAFVLPESARELKVQAESAVREKRLLDASDRFSKALAISPAWASGRYNLALVYGELEFPSLAIAEMSKYLTLAPDAENARAAQDKIYAWRDKVKR